MKNDLCADRSLLSDDDRYYLSSNLELEVAFEDDPQAQSVYSAEANEIQLHSPIWTRAQVISAVQSHAKALDLRVRVVFRRQLDQYAHVGRGGGTIFLPEDRMHPNYRPLKDGEYLACTVFHELAHILAPCAFPGRTFRSHGAEFVRCYVDLLASVMWTDRALEAFAFLGVT